MNRLLPWDLLACKDRAAVQEKRTDSTLPDG